MNSVSSSDSPHAANISISIPSSSSSSSSKKRAFSPSYYPGPPPTVRTSSAEGALRVGLGHVTSKNNDSTESIWRLSGGQLQQSSSEQQPSKQQQPQQQQQQPQQQPQQHQHSDISVKIRRKTIDGAGMLSAVSASKTGALSANRITPLEFGANLTQLPSASALNASLKAAAAPLMNAAGGGGGGGGKDSLMDVAAAALKNAARKRTAKKSTKVR